MNGFGKRLIFLSLAAILFFWTGRGYTQGQQTLAILKFDSPGAVSLGAEVTKELVQILAMKGQFRIVSRELMRSVAGELRLEASGPLTTERLVQVGRFAGADLVMVGKVERGDPLSASYRLIDVRTGGIITKGWASGYGGPHQLALSISDNLRESLPRQGQVKGPAIAESRRETFAGEDMAKDWKLEEKQAFERRQTADRYEQKPTVVQETKDNRPPVITITSPEVKRGIRIVAKEEGLTVTGRATDESGVASVTVNEEKAVLDENGNFSADILLKVGDNKITVTAIDTRKNRTTESFTIRREGGKIAKSKGDARTAARKGGDAGLSAGRSFALVIGINNYEDAIGRLKTAAGDAKSICDVLAEHYNFQCTLLLDGSATREGILKALDDLKKKLNPEDRLLIYYAGHGYYEKDTDTSFWLPVDAEKNNTIRWIDAKSITNELNRSQARQILIVADSCYAGTMTRSFSPSLEGHGAREIYLSKMMEKKSRVLIASGGNEPVSDSGVPGHSIFAAVLLKALKNPFSRSFTAEELMIRHIKESVGGQSEQTPEYRIIKNSGHEGGDFVFIKEK
ncbi:MAG: caspase family protein [Syntrophobacterales bacterium]|nr:caspase family protein [Syntrophobacterales bacterium]